jgi:hypothetical protein
VRHGLVVARAWCRMRSDYVRWQRPAPMALGQLDVVYERGLAAKHVTRRPLGPDAYEGRRFGPRSLADAAARACFSCACAHDGRAAPRLPEAIRRTSCAPRRSFAAQRATRCPPGDRTRAAAPACALARVPWASPRVLPRCLSVTTIRLGGPSNRGLMSMRLKPSRYSASHAWALVADVGKKEAGAAVVVRVQRQWRDRGPAIASEYQLLGES